MLLRTVTTEHPRSLRLIGEIDLSNASDLTRLLRCERDALPGRDVALDLGELRFIDSSGMRVLLGAARELHAEGRSLVMRDVPPGIRRIFGVMGLDKAPGILLEERFAEGEPEGRTPGVRRDASGRPHRVARARCACGCPYLYAADDLALFWEPGHWITPGCTDAECQCHVAPLRG